MNLGWYHEAKLSSPKKEFFGEEGFLDFIFANEQTTTNSEMRNLFMNVLVGGAWPYANGSLHIGHIAALLPGDILARYHRAKGNKVFYVSGSDCHGTPVSIRAKQENKTPQEISDFYHEEFNEIFDKLGFSYDLYGKTSSDEHKDFVREFHRKMYEGGYIYEKTIPQAYCERCQTFLADRLVIGKCPKCSEKARGDQCDACGTVLEPETLDEPRCSVCGETPVFRESKHLYIAISKLENELSIFIDSHPHWRKNAVAFTNRYINEGLPDRAVTRDLDWGIDVPKVGYEDKKIYIWAENVLGYLSMSYKVAVQRGDSFEELWGKNALHYYVHGKDNIPFHTIILPALLLANGENWRLPDEIISSEYMTLEGKKISTSRNWAIWAKDIVDKYNPDSLRYFFIANGPERKDTNFSWREYLYSHNSELLGAYGNFVNRSLVFINKYFSGIVPNGKIENEINSKISNLYVSVGRKIENGYFKDALDEVFDFVRYSNKYFDASEPWKTRNSNISSCNNTLYNCVQIIANLSVLLSPYLPFSSAKIIKWLNVTSKWGMQLVAGQYKLPEIEILFDRLDKKIVDEELSRLGV